MAVLENRVIVSRKFSHNILLFDSESLTKKVIETFYPTVDLLASREAFIVRNLFSSLSGLSDHEIYFQILE